MAIVAVALSSAMRTTVTTGGAAISTPTAGTMTRRPRNVSTRTMRMAPTYGTRTSTNQPADSPTRSLLELAVAKAMEEADAALAVAEAVDEAVEDSKAVAAFRAVAVDEATTTTTMVAVVKVTTTEIKAPIMEAPLKALTFKATGAVITVHIRLWYSLYNKVARPAQVFTMLLCPVPSWFPYRWPLAWPQDNRGMAATAQPLVVRARLAWVVLTATLGADPRVAQRDE